MAKVRLFTAVCLSAEIEISLKAVLEKVSSKGSEMKWVTDSQWHLTLLFLGEREESLVPRLMELFQETAAAFPPFSMELGGVGAFPNLKHPKVLFVPATRGAESFQELSGALRAKTESAGLDVEKKEIQPHVTLGRAREGKNVQEVVRFLRESCPTSLGILSVNRFYIFRSELTPAGAAYTRLGEIPLSGGPAL